MGCGRLRYLPYKIYKIIERIAPQSLQLISSLIRIWEFKYGKIDANLPSVKPMQIGTVLRNRYKINRFLGSGGFGDTYLAEDLDLPGSPQCVVKHFKPKNTAPLILEAARVLFDREAKVLYNLGQAHDQIPRLFAHIEEQGLFYLVQEFIDGHTLDKELIAGQKWSEASVVKLLKEILEVLTVVHQHGVIHRDIKPANLMRRQKDNNIVLIDFGAVKEINVLSVDTEGHTTSTIAIGTAGYMPPEQAHGHPQFASDVFAVGVLGIQALLGRMPQQDSKTGELIWKDFVSISPQTAKVLDKMTCYHFRDRYASAQIASSALVETVISLRPKPYITPDPFAETIISPHSIPLTEKSAPSKLAETVFQPQAESSSTQKRWLLYGLGGCALILVLVAGNYWIRNSQNNIPTIESDRSTEKHTEQQYLDEIKKYNEAIKLNPQDATAYYNRGLAKYNLGNNQEAIQDYGEAIKLDSQDATAYYNRGLAKYGLSDNQGAIEDYDEAIKLNPQYVNAYYNRGLSQEELGNHQLAIQDFDEVIKLNSEDADAYYNRGLAEYNLSNNEVAIKNFNKAIQLNQKDANYYIQRGNSRYNLGNNQGAIQDYDEAIKLNPQEANAYDNRGMARATLDNKRGAISDYQQAADLYKSQGKMELYQSEIEKIQNLGG